MHRVSSKNKYRITIVMINIAGPGYHKPMNDFFKSYHTYWYNDSTIMNDLYEWIMKGMRYKTKHFLSNIFRIKVGDKEIHAQSNFNLRKFIKLNQLKKLEVNFLYGMGGGCDLNVGVVANIRINPNEKRHRYIPHVHIYRGKSRSYDNETRINLADMSTMKNTQKELNDLFNRNESELILSFLWKYRDDLIEYYNSIQRGEKPDTIYIDYEGNRTYFC
nr:hypothetical protein [Bacilli bacterium]